MPRLPTLARALACVCALAWPLTSLAAESASRPLKVVGCGLVATNTLALEILAGDIVFGSQAPYVPETQDRVEDRDGQRWVSRGGHMVGVLVGPQDRVLYTLDRVSGERLDTTRAGQPDAFAIDSPDDAAYRAPTPPQHVWRKSRLTAMGRVGPWQFDFPMQHHLYLVLPHLLTPGCHYTIRAQLGAHPLQHTFRFEPTRDPSEAVHVSQLGFRPDDPAKTAYLSCWMGDGGGAVYATNTTFTLRDTHANDVVYRGRAALAKRVGDPEDPYQRNYNGTDVFRMDFSDWTRPGTYRVCVEGLGCSRPFDIAPDVWQRAFIVAARGFYHQRSGIALGPPYTTFTRPRGFHPADGVRVYQSTCSLLDSGNGLNARGTDHDNFGNLVQGRTDVVETNAWGGYFDAGDWDRRIQHLDATRLLLELVELFPDSLARLPLNIPESGNGLPDLINESLWNLDCYRRLQTVDGGIRGGIESAAHPRFGEGSWQEQLTVMVYAPDLWSSYVYAGVAARAARLLQPRATDRSAVYTRSALRAMEYAERTWASNDYAHLPHAVTDARNLAAAELLSLTGDLAWQRVFLQTTAFTNATAELFLWQHHEQRDAAFVYASLPASNAVADVRRHAMDATRREADACAAMAEDTGFNWTRLHAWQPAGYGNLSAPQIKTLARAYVLFRDPRYVRAAVLAAQFGVGANPGNRCFTTGIGAQPPRDPLWIDSRVQGREPPPGLTVYGPIDVQRHATDWPFGVMGNGLYPSHDQWPTTEAYWDFFLFPAVTEFTVMETLGPNTYAWGFLAGRL